MNPSDIEVRYSGGAANSNPAASLGSTMSSVEVISQTVGSPTNVTGVVIDRAVNLPAEITLYCYPDGSNRYIGWWGPEFLKGYAYVTSSGEYTVFSPSGDPSDGYIDITVTLGSTSASSVEDTLTVTNNTENIFEDVTSAEAGTVDVQYRCVYIHNGHGSETISSLKLWVGKEYEGEESIALAVDTNGVGGTAVTIADSQDSTDQLSGLSFTSPLAEAAGIEITNIGPGVSVPIWLRRTVNGPVQEALSLDSFGISMAAYV